MGVPQGKNESDCVRKPIYLYVNYPTFKERFHAN
jgi:hypothetical protein